MYCTACEEDFPSPQPDGMCLVCGEDLISSPPTNNNNNINNNATIDNRQSSSLSRASSSSQRQGDDDDDDDDAAATNAMALLASSMENATAINPSALLPLVHQLRGTNPGEQGGAGTVFGNTNNVDDLAGMMLPPDALNPQAGTSASRPTSKSALDNLKRIVLTAQSAELFDAQIRLFEPRRFTDLSPVIGSGGGCMTLNAVPGEFGPMASSAATTTDANDGSAETKRQRMSSPSHTAAIVVCSPRTTKGGKLSPQTLAEIATLRRNRMSFVAYVERGDVTFVQKALVCQHAGELETTSNNSNAKSKKSLCIGVIVGNTTSGGGKNEVWPFVMQDTKKEAQKYALTIPVVMVRREDGTRIVQWAKRKHQSGGDGDVDSNSKCYTPCQIDIHSKEANSHTCPVCTDSFVPGETIVRLECGHVFHESCALAWLTKHNTCPFCRKELPTDDEDYERERRRRESSSNSGDGGATGEINGHNFYG